MFCTCGISGIDCHEKGTFSFPAPVSTVLVPSTFELDYKYTLIIVVIMC